MFLFPLVHGLEEINQMAHQKNKIGEEAVVTLYGTQERGCTLDTLLAECLAEAGNVKYRLAILEYMGAYGKPRAFYYSRKHALLAQFWGWNVEPDRKVPDDWYGRASVQYRPFTSPVFLYTNRRWCAPFNSKDCTIKFSKMALDRYKVYKEEGNLAQFLEIES